MKEFYTLFDQRNNQVGFKPVPGSGSTVVATATAARHGLEWYEWAVPAAVAAGLLVGCAVRQSRGPAHASCAKASTDCGEQKRPFGCACAHAHTTARCDAVVRRRERGRAVCT